MLEKKVMGQGRGQFRITDKTEVTGRGGVKLISLSESVPLPPSHILQLPAVSSNPGVHFSISISECWTITFQGGTFASVDEEIRPR